MAQIKILPPDVSNKIAAGEVVERPASAVKELVENAVDARSTSVGVEVRAGGKRLLRVSDNGTGMTREDALIALERHATSKVRCIEDLQRIQTFGFRGEALPSIASVSQFELLTRTADALEGHQSKCRRRRGAIGARERMFAGHAYYGQQPVLQRACAPEIPQDWNDRA